MKTKKDELFSMFDHMLKTLEEGGEIEEDCVDKIYQFVQSHEKELLKEIESKPFLKNKLNTRSKKSIGFRK